MKITRIRTCDIMSSTIAWSAALNRDPSTGDVYDTTFTSLYRIAMKIGSFVNIYPQLFSKPLGLEYCWVLRKYWVLFCNFQMSYNSFYWRFSCQSYISWCVEKRQRYKNKFGNRSWGISVHIFIINSKNINQCGLAPFHLYFTRNCYSVTMLLCYSISHNKEIPAIECLTCPEMCP